MRIALLGDIALFGRSVRPDYFKPIGDYLANFDYVVGNLETPFSKEKKTSGAKSAYICADPSTVYILKILHLNAVTLANNHMFDYGKEGYELTKKLLEESGIQWFGGEGKDLKIEIDENKIIFTGYCCYSSNPLRCIRNGGYGVNSYDLETVKKIIIKNSSKGYLNIIAVHAGIEHVNYPSLDHIRAARMLADECQYVYYGHHPHVIQGIENYKGSIIAHSLGNFYFDDVYTDASKEPLVALTENNRTGMILELTIENNKVIELKEQVIFIPKDGVIKLVEKDDCIEEYNSDLIHSEENPKNYIARRNAIINNHIAERKAMRNLQWYLKRLRPKYVKLIMDGRKNKRLYDNYVKKYI